MTDLNYTYTFASGSTAVASQVNQNFTDVKNVVGGHIDDDNISPAGITGSTKLKDGTVTAAKLASEAVIESKADYAYANSGLLVVRAGPSYWGDGGVRMARVVRNITIAGATTTLQSYQITFASDCPDGDPAFTAAPTIFGVTLVDPGTHSAPDVITSGAREAQNFITDLDENGCYFNIMFSTTATAGDLELHIGLMGPVA